MPIPFLSSRRARILRHRKFWPVVALAWLGVVSSALLVVIIPLQHAGLFGGPTNWSSSLTWFAWLQCLVFELTLAVWLLTKGVATPAQVT